MATTLIQRLLRRPVNWLVETFYPDGAFYGGNYFTAFDQAVDPSNAAVSSTSAAACGLLICNASEANADELSCTFSGHTMNGKPTGDWRITLKRLRPAGKDEAWQPR